jgi:peptide/nickel transport system substrate-binding protein
MRNDPRQLEPGRRSFLRRVSLLALGAGTGTLPGVSWSAARDVLHVRNYVDLSTLDPPMTLSGGEGTVVNAIHLSLIRFRPGDSWTWELEAAEAFEQLDATRYAFRLRPGIRFTNGFGEMTAADVKYSLERIIDPALNAPNLPDMGTLSHVEVTGRYSGIIVLKSPFAAFILVGLCGASGAILSEQGMRSVGGRYDIEPPCCSGPYRFVSWQAKRKTVLVRNPDWDGAPGPFREIHVYALPEAKAAEMSYEAGELDFSHVSVEAVEVFRRDMPVESRLQLIPGLRYRWVGINREHPKLKDIRVRQAVQYGIDVDAVIEAAWFGLATPATGIIAPGMIGHRPASDVPRAGDPQRARSLLAEAGVKLPLKLILSLEANALNLAIGQVVQWSLAKIGIEVELDVQDNATMITMGHESSGERWRDVQLFVQSFIMLGDPYYATCWFIGKQVGVWNWERFRSEEFDRLHEQAMASSIPADRDRMYQRMQHLMEASGCYRFLAHDPEPYLSRTWLVPATNAGGHPMLRSFRLGA